MFSRKVFEGNRGFIKIPTCDFLLADYQVVARFNDFITKLLLEGAKETFQRHGAADEDVEVCFLTLVLFPRFESYFSGLHSLLYFSFLSLDGNELCLSFSS